MSLFDKLRSAAISTATFESGQDKLRGHCERNDHPDSIQKIINNYTANNRSIKSDCLYFSCRNGSSQVVKMLLNTGLDTNDYHSSIRFEPPLITTIKHCRWPTINHKPYSGKYEETVRILLHNRSRPAEVDKRELHDGATPLMEASSQASPSIVNALLCHGADINLCDYSGNNSLMYAVRYGDYGIDTMDTVSILVGSGIDPLAQNQDGLNAFDLASISYKDYGVTEHTNDVLSLLKDAMHVKIR